jgi:hypothetical protein
MSSLKDFEWEDVVTEKYAIRILDITKMQHGEQIEVLIMDRNLSCITSQVNESNTNYEPEIFYRYNRGTYVHDKDLMGKLIFHWKDTTEVDENFEFHLEYLPKNWYPIMDGKLSTSTSTMPLNQHWSNFSPDTKVGYRGPMIPWCKLKEMPNIYLKRYENKIYKCVCLDIDNPPESFDLHQEYRFIGSKSSMAAKKFSIIIWNKFKKCGKVPDKITIKLVDPKDKIIIYFLIKNEHNSTFDLVKSLPF